MMIKNTEKKTDFCKLCNWNLSTIIYFYLSQEKKKTYNQTFIGVNWDNGYKLVAFFRGDVLYKLKVLFAI